MISPLLSRDVLLSQKQQYSLLLTYKLTMDAAGSIEPTASKIHNVLYESTVDAQFIMVSDAWKRTVGYSDTFPASIKLGKGTYTIRLEVRPRWCELQRFCVSCPQKVF